MLRGLFLNLKMEVLALLVTPLFQTMTDCTNPPVYPPVEGLHAHVSD